jgi:hypothetical protein
VILGITGDADEHTLQEFASAGANGCLVKVVLLSLIAVVHVSTRLLPHLPCAAVLYSLPSSASPPQPVSRDALLARFAAELALQASKNEH